MAMALNPTAGTGSHAITLGSMLPAQLSIRERQGKPWSPALFGSILWHGLTHIKTHREVLRLLLKSPAFTEILFGNPIFAIKYLFPGYLAYGFTVAECASCFLHNYKRLYAVFPDSLIHQIQLEDVTIYKVSEDANRFALTMGMSRTYSREGELSLYLRVDGEAVYVLSFTIVPGCVVKSEAAEVLLISRLQGVKGAYHQIGLATKALHDVAPGALLLATLQGIANALEISEIAAVSATKQPFYNKSHAASFKEAYDDFFSELGMSKRENGFYYASVPLQGKPLTLIKPGHKLRTKEKRAFKQQIQSTCTDIFEGLTSNASHKL